jgi:hypothetical protein
MDTSELEERQAGARAKLKSLTPPQRQEHIAQKRNELANTLELLNEQLVELALVDVPIKLTVSETGITRRRKNVDNAPVEMSPVPGLIQIVDVTDFPS